MTEEQKEKYANFLDKVSEILGLNKPVDILRLCAVTDEYLRPIEKRIAELEKANEWHYVKDGDLPKHEVNVLVLFNEQCIDIAHYNWDYKEWHFTDSIVRDVIAWKEIVLPLRQ